MKKSLLTALALCALTTAGLTSCGEKPEVDPTEEVKPTEGGADIQLTVPEGQSAYVLKLAEESVVLEEFNSIWVTGCMLQEGTADWPVGLAAIEMKADVLDGYLVGFAKEWNEEEYLKNENQTQPRQYAAVVGYNAKADIADDKKGLQWNDSYKSLECAAFAFPNNAEFTYNAETRIADLGTHTFAAQPAKPQPPLNNYTFQVEFSNPIPEWATPHIMGSWDWSRTTANPENMAYTAMTTTDEARKVWQYKFDTMLAGDYEYTMSIDYNAAEAYSWTKPEELGGPNLKFSVMQVMGDNFVADPVALTVKENVLPDPTKIADVKIVVKDVNGAALKEDVSIFVCGNFTVWTADDSSKLSLSEDKTELYKEFIGITAGDLEFGIVSGADWKHCFKAPTEEEGKLANFKVTVDAQQRVVVTITGDIKATFYDSDPAVQTETAGELTTAEWAK